MSTARRLTLLPLVAASAVVAYAKDTGTVDTGAVDSGAVVPANPGSVILVDPLDEAADGEFYCADVLGSTVDEGDRMQVHTCNHRPLPAEDMEFTTDYPHSGNIYVTQADLCVAARRLRAGSYLNVVACSARDAHQQWDSKGDGQIHLASDDTLCWAVDPGLHGLCGNPRCTNYKRTLRLQPCADYDATFITWSIPGGAVGL
jgi:hypothetical protein